MRKEKGGQVSHMQPAESREPGSRRYRALVARRRRMARRRQE